MTEREQVIAELMYLKHDCLEGSATDQTLDKAIALLKAQEPATIEPKRIDLTDETKAWLDKMDAVDALGNIANICMDWDGYRTANGLGGLINEIWAYARYSADRLLKSQEPRVMTWQNVIGAAIECKPLYIEVKNSEDKEPGDDRWAMVTQYKDSITNGMIRAMSSYITSEILFKDWYGKTWRCWTSRPDQATREAIPWN